MPRSKSHRTRCCFRGGPADGLHFTIVTPLCLQLVMRKMDLDCGGRQHRYTLAEREGGVLLFQHQGPLPVTG